VAGLKIQQELPPDLKRMCGLRGLMITDFGREHRKGE